MIYCPQCGTANKPNSKFCKNCGALLAPSTDVRCPICGAMNPHGAANCSTCGTRLATTAVSASSPDLTTPADAPETIAPLNPSTLGGGETSPAPPSGSRPSFSRSSSEWLRRIQKTPPASTPPQSETAPAPEPAPAPETPPAPIPPVSETTQTAPADTRASETVVAAAAAAPVLSDIKLTSDDYDYSDVTGTVTDEMKAQLEAERANVQSVEDEVALARRLLGLDVETTDVPAQQVSAPTAAPQDAAPQAVAPPTIAAQPAPAPATRAEAVVSPAATELETPAVSSAETTAQVTPPATAEREQEDAHRTATLAAAAATAAKTPELGELSLPEKGAELEAGELPDWLREIAPPDAPSAAETDAGENLDVQDLVPGAAALGTTALLSHLPELDEQERGELPDWLREPVPAPAAETEPPPEEPTAEPPLATPLELPAWMTSPGAGPRDAFEAVETTGPLAGISGILPLALAITEPHNLTTPTPARSNGGRIFQTILSEPLAAPTQTAQPAAARGWFTANHLLYLLILLAALIPLFLPFDLSGLGLSVTDTPSAAFYDQLQAVPAKGTVLMAFEYTPGQAVELDPAARAIVNTLVARQANVIALAANPNGAALAEDILAPARQFNPQFTAVNVGYLPGAEAGLRALASGWLPADHPLVNGTTWGSSPLAAGIRSMDDLALTVVLAGDEGSLRAWMEQVEPRVQPPMIAATTATLEPQARNYVNANQLRASLRGLTGAAELELLSNQAGQAVRTVDALSFVSLLLAGMIIAANVVFLLRRK